MRDCDENGLRGLRTHLEDVALALSGASERAEDECCHEAAAHLEIAGGHVRLADCLVSDAIAAQEEQDDADQDDEG